MVRPKVKEDRLSISPEKSEAARKIIARRTAFISRFIILREGKRSRAHRDIEMMEWGALTTAEELANKFREAFEKNGDKLEFVDKDINRALAHANRSVNHFIDQYLTRATTNFIDALFDYEKSNNLLFGDDKDEETPLVRTGGWRLPHQLLREKLSTEKQSTEE